jgi:prolyl 4-hydroxylase
MQFTLNYQRPFPLKGRHYANVFIHFEPVDAFEGEEFVNDSDLPPYIVPNSPEAENWLDDHPEGWSKEVGEMEMPTCNAHAAEGQVGRLKELVELDPRVVNFSDDNGWQPLHEAVRMGQFEAVKYLVEQGADINARTYDGLGPSPLNIAKYSLGFEHPVYLLLDNLGAEDHEDQYYMEGEEEWDEEEEWDAEEEWDEEEDDSEEEEEDHEEEDEAENSRESGNEE